jgi:hypothetical protein
MIDEQIETSKKEQIIKWLAYYGVHNYVEIEKEAEDIILMALMKQDVTRAFVNKEGALIIEFEDSAIGE